MKSWKEIRWFLERAIISSPSTGNIGSGTVRFENTIYEGIQTSSVCVANVIRKPWPSAFDYNLVWVTCTNFVILSGTASNMRTECGRDFEKKNMYRVFHNKGRLKKPVIFSDIVQKGGYFLHALMFRGQAALGTFLYQGLSLCAFFKSLSFASKSLCWPEKVTQKLKTHILANGPHLVSPQ